MSDHRGFHGRSDPGVPKQPKIPGVTLLDLAFHAARPDSVGPNNMIKQSTVPFRIDTRWKTLLAPLVLQTKSIIPELFVSGNVPKLLVLIRHWKVENVNHAIMD